VFLVEHPGQVFGKMQLLSQVWGPEFDGDAHTVESRMSRLRLAIEENPNQPAYLHSRRSVGYYLTLEPRP
jgi:two-component system response regulator VicR